MKKYVVLFVLMLTGSLSSAQLPDGSTAPDFTFTDLSGTTHHLYTYLNQGKYVAMEVSATWCSPCWAYHTSGAMDSLYNLHDLPGDQAWKVFFIEGDGSTTEDQLNGIGTTQGNWVAGALFPIMNPSGTPLNDFKAGYDANSFPTLYMICPNKKVYQDTINKYPRGYVSTWNYVAATQCAAAGLDNVADANPLTIFPNPAKDHVVLYFGLNRTADVSLFVTNMLGQLIDSKNYGSLFPGDQSIRYDLDNYEAGLYFFTVSDDGGRQVHKKVIVR